MNKWMEEKLLPLVSKLSQNRFLSAVRDGIAVIIPFTVIGALALIVGQFPIESWMNFIDQYAITFTVSQQ